MNANTNRIQNLLNSESKKQAIESLRRAYLAVALAKAELEQLDKNLPAAAEFFGLREDLNTNLHRFAGISDLATDLEAAIYSLGEAERTFDYHTDGDCYTPASIVAKVDEQVRTIAQRFRSAEREAAE